MASDARRGARGPSVGHDLVDEGHVRQEDAPAAVPVETELVERLAGALSVLDHVDVGLVEAADDLSAREATDGYDHRLHLTCTTSASSCARRARAGASAPCGGGR